MDQSQQYGNNNASSLYASIQSHNPIMMEHPPSYTSTPAPTSFTRYDESTIQAFTFEKAHRMYTERQTHLWNALSNIRLSIESDIRQTSMTVRNAHSLVVYIPLTLQGFPDYDPEDVTNKIADWLRDEEKMEVTKLSSTSLLVDWTNAPAGAQFLGSRARDASSVADKALSLAFERMYTEVSVELRKACTLGTFECWIELPQVMTGYALYTMEEAITWIMRRANECGFKLERLSSTVGKKDSQQHDMLYWSYHRQLGLPIPKRVAKAPKAERELGDIAHATLANPNILVNDTPFVRATSNIIASYATTQSTRSFTK